MPNISLQYSSKITNVTWTGRVHAIPASPLMGITRTAKSTYPCQATSTKLLSDLIKLHLTNHNTNHIPTRSLPTAQPSSTPNTLPNHLQQPKQPKIHHASGQGTPILRKSSQLHTSCCSYLSSICASSTNRTHIVSCQVVPQLHYNPAQCHPHVQEK